MGLNHYLGQPVGVFNRQRNKIIHVGKINGQQSEDIYVVADHWLDPGAARVVEEDYLIALPSFVGDKRTANLWWTMCYIRDNSFEHSQIEIEEFARAAVKDFEEANFRER